MSIVRSESKQPTNIYLEKTETRVHILTELETGYRYFTVASSSSLFFRRRAIKKKKKNDFGRYDRNPCPDASRAERMPPHIGRIGRRNLGARKTEWSAAIFRPDRCVYPWPVVAARGDNGSPNNIIISSRKDTSNDELLLSSRRKPNPKRRRSDDHTSLTRLIDTR